MLVQLRLVYYTSRFSSLNWSGQQLRPTTGHPEIKYQVKTLHEQIVQSESNLTAQWTVLQQMQRFQ